MPKTRRSTALARPIRLQLLLGDRTCQSSGAVGFEPDHAIAGQDGEEAVLVLSPSEIGQMRIGALAREVAIGNQRVEDVLDLCWLDRGPGSAVSDDQWLGLDLDLDETRNDHLRAQPSTSGGIHRSEPCADALYPLGKLPIVCVNDRGQMIGVRDDDASAGTQHTEQLTHRRLGMAQVLEHSLGIDGVEARILERQGGDIRVSILHIAQA